MWQRLLKMRSFVVVAKVCKDGFCREDLEILEGNTYTTLKKAVESLKLSNPRADITSVQFIEFGEFTKDWNDTDDDGNYLPNVMETFIGYIFIEQ